MTMDLTQALQKATEFLATELAQLRTGRANPALAEEVKADAYGTLTPIKQLAQVSVPEATVIVVSPWDKGLVGPIETALKQAEIGQVSNDGALVRITLPPMTEERRQEFAKLASEKLEAARVSVRNARREAIESAEAENLPEDGLKRRKEEIDTLAGKSQKQLEEMTEAKQQEIATV